MLRQLAECLMIAMKLMVDSKQQGEMIGAPTLGRVSYSEFTPRFMTATSPTRFQAHRKVSCTMAATMANGDASHTPLEVSFPLPRAPHTNIHLQLTNNGPNLILFLTTATPESASSAPLGSFVYAMPNVGLSCPPNNSSVEN